MASAERLRLERLLEGVEVLVRRAFLEFLRSARSDEVLRAIADALERRDVEAAMRIVDSYVVRFSTVIPRAFQRAARLEMEQAERALRPIAGAVAISFDPAAPAAAALMRRQQLQLIREFSSEQRRATALALSEALSTGAGPREAARAFRGSIGLTARQERAALNYERLLREGSAEALSRDARDRRFDRTVRAAIRTGEPLSPAQVDRMGERYREGYLSMRAETIARTETTRVVGAARREAFRQTIDDLGLDRTKVRRVWNSTLDKRTRDSHRDMDGQEVELDEPFVSGAGNRIMFPGDPDAPAEEVINCRCVVTNRVL